MADKINVSIDQLNATAGTFEKKNLAMDKALNKIQQIMQSLEGSWVSDAGEEVRNNMYALKPRIEEYKNVVNSYKDFLIKTAETYKTTEEGLTSQASEFKS